VPTCSRWLARDPVQKRPGAARAARDSLPDIAARSEISVVECSLRFGLHWGATLCMGRILTGGRSEVTPLGGEVDETARIEACATRGRTLASKSLSNG
jgi:class 3 adenylate cyclase